MDDIQRRADHEAWDKKADRRISNIDQVIEQGVTGEALAALHGLHFPPANDINRWQDIDPESALSLLQAAIAAVATMIEIYRRRFYN